MARRYALSDSDSDSEPDKSDTPSQPSDKELEQALRDAVAKIYKTGKIEELTVKRVRLAAEKELQLEEGFFKASDDWKARSDRIIKDEVEVQDAAGQDSQADEPENAHSPSPVTTKPTKREKPKTSSAPRKRRKTNSGSEVDSDFHDEGGERTKPTKKQKPAAKTKPEPELSEEKVLDDSDANEEQNTKSAGQTAEAGGDSESEMSVVLDEEHEHKTKRQRPKKSAGGLPGKTKKKAPTKAKDADTDPNQAEIKRLQGWLIKCGIRKMWARELAPYETPRAKIKHLKDMLKDAGMEGRYSVEKARQIKEERELREDLELVQEGAKRWGREEEGAGSDGAQPRRRLNRGLKSLAFLESDGEETD
ncbi:putative transcriptional regulator [Aspergillus lucknowensis]|uniref:Transcriptional regulator n=1 Tax=Aspergillus lucknowensis TaxID=176173 RepID=A0ABR4LMT7_9EURO